MDDRYFGQTDRHTYIHTIKWFYICPMPCIALDRQLPCRSDAAVKLRNACKLLLHSARPPPSCSLDTMTFFKLCILAFRMAANWRLLVTYLLLDPVRLCFKPKQLIVQRIAGFSGHDSIFINSSDPSINDISYSLSIFLTKCDNSGSPMSLKIWQKE